MFAAQQTRKGRIVYKRKKHIYSGRDMTRIVIAVNNNSTGNYVNWQAVFKIAFHNYQALLPVEKRSVRDDKFIEVLKAVGDFINNYLVPLFEDVPGAGQLLAIVSYVYTLARDYTD